MQYETMPIRLIIKDLKSRLEDKNRPISLPKDMTIIPEFKLRTIIKSLIKIAIDSNKAEYNLVRHREGDCQRLRELIDEENRLYIMEREI